MLTGTGATVQVVSSLQCTAIHNSSYQTNCCQVSKKTGGGWDVHANPTLPHLDFHDDGACLANSQKTTTTKAKAIFKQQLHPGSLAMRSLMVMTAQMKPLHKISSNVRIWGMRIWASSYVANKSFQCESFHIILDGSYH